MAEPNILILCSDEHARGALGCYGSVIAQTPTLDRLAAQGTRFSRAYTPSPICVPARASIATGLHVHEHGCWSSAQPFHGQHESWMRRLREAGREVVSIGKLHFRSGDDDNGFSEEILPMHLANGGRGWPQALLRDPMPAFHEAAELAREIGRGESVYTEYDRRVTEAACDWLLGRAAPEPWAAFVSFVSPHYPLIAPAPFYDLYQSVPDERLAPLIDAPPDHPVLRQMAAFWNYDSHFDAKSRAVAQRAYYGLCSFLDANIRQVLLSLEASGAASNTLVVYLSDHGEMLGSHGFWTKSVMYEDSVGVPLILSGPGVPAGMVNPTPVCLTDLSPTLIDAAGLTPPDPRLPWRARPLSAFFDRPDPGRPVLSEYHDGGSPTGFYMVRSEDWKYVHYAGGGPDQLFNLRLDPLETNNLAAGPEYALERARLFAMLHGMLDPEAVNARAFADQRRLIAQFGGEAAIQAQPSFNHTPIDFG